MAVQTQTFGTAILFLTKTGNLLLIIDYLLCF